MHFLSIRKPTASPLQKSICQRCLGEIIAVIRDSCDSHMKDIHTLNNVEVGGIYSYYCAYKRWYRSSETNPLFAAFNQDVFYVYVGGGGGKVGTLYPLDSFSELVAQLVNKLPNFHVTRRFITVFTTTRNLYLGPDESCSHPRAQSL